MSCLGLTCEILSEFHVSCFGLFELSSPCRDRGIVLLGRCGCRTCRGVSCGRLRLDTFGKLLRELCQLVFSPSHFRLQFGPHSRHCGIVPLRRLDQHPRRFGLRFALRGGNLLSRAGL